MVLPLAAPASASSASCKTLNSKPPTSSKGVLTSHSTVSKCTPTSSTGGSGTGVSLIPGVWKGKKVEALSTTTWASGKGTTITTLVYTAAKSVGNCPKGSILRETSVGTVVGGTNKAFPVGAKITATVCVAKNDSATLAPGTVETL